MRASLKTELQGYAVALLMVAVALLASHMSLPLSRSAPWVFFFTAVIAAAWFGGLRPSVVATGLLAILGRFFFMSPPYSLALSRDNLVLVLVFIGVSLFIGYIVAARRQAEDHERVERRRFEATVRSIGDAVIATDAVGRVTFMNEVAQHLTGWELREAAGRRLEEVFVIVDEASRGVTSSPVEQVLKSGKVQGLANHTVLIARDGSERPIDDSAAPIRIDDGELTGVVLVFRDVTERKQAERSMRLHASQLQKLAEIASRINTAHDVNDVMGIVTEDARELIGSHQSVIGFTIDDSWAQAINHVSLSEKYAEWRSYSAPPDGSGIYSIVCRMNRPMRLTQAELERHPAWTNFGEASDRHPPMRGWLAAPLVGRDGKNLGLIQLSDKYEGEFTAEDEAILTQLAQLASVAIENARLYQELRSNDERKDEFLAMLAHELRNPLAAISNAVKLSTRSGLREHVEWSREVVGRQVSHLTRLIDDLLDVSRISRGKIELRKLVVDATTIIDSAVSMVTPLVAERKHTLDVAIDRGELWIDADPTRIEQAVVNLLNNAAKYSEDGGRIQVVALNDGPDVVITVRDQGMGVPPEKLSGMFELFAQGDRSLARSEGGLGIGLTVVKKLVEMHGGSITANSEGKGKGSEFTIRLPASARPAGVVATTADPKDTATGKIRILIVDDNIDMALGMSQLLNLIGHETATAHDGHEAIEKAREQRPELILLDIGLPGMDGYEVASRLRREESCKNAVIVAISGYGQENDRRRSKEAGFDHHLIKPLDHDALMALLTNPGVAGV